MDNDLDLIKENIQALTMLNIRLYSLYTELLFPDVIWTNKQAEAIYNKNFKAIRFYNELIERIEDEKC